MTSKDPIGLEGGLNLYVAFGNNPVNYRDPTGTDIYYESTQGPEGGWSGGHAALYIDDPSLSSGVRRFEFSPANGGYMQTGDANGAVFGGLAGGVFGGLGGVGNLSGATGAGAGLLDDVMSGIAAADGEMVGMGINGVVNLVNGGCQK